MHAFCVFNAEEYMTFSEADFEAVVIQDSQSNIYVTLKVKFVQTNTVTVVRLNNHNHYLTILDRSS